jgi:hypothetical protein
VRQRGAAEEDERVSSKVPLYEVVLVSQTGQVQFRMWVEDPRPRIARELVPLLNRGGEEHGWTAEIRERRLFEM